MAQKPWTYHLRAGEVARRLGGTWTAARWRTYVDRGDAPPADSRGPDGFPRWSRSTVDRYARSRPGERHRTDIHGEWRWWVLEGIA